MSDEGLDRRNQFELLRSEMDNERSSFIPHWRDLQDYILPRRGRFFVQDVNQGDRRTNKIIDSTSTLAARTLRSGMMGGVTSPARPWFRLTLDDVNQSAVPGAQRWLHTVSERMRNVFLRSNLYQTLPIVYGDMGTFATAALLMEEDFDNVVRFTPYPIGSYMIGTNNKGIVDKFIREYRMTVSQVVEEFGRQPDGEIDWSNISETVKAHWDNKQRELWVDIVHVIRPNDGFVSESIVGNEKKYISVHYETGITGRGSGTQLSSMGGGAFSGKFLREAGFDFFPVLAPRWEITGEDIYGTSCPGMTALGDILQLQTGEKKGLKALDKMIDPPLVGPSVLRNHKVSLLPGDVTYTDFRDGQAGLKPIHEVQFRMDLLEGKQQQVRERINSAYFVDLFRMISQLDRREITAREIDARQEEKLLALGPVLEQLNQDLLDPLVENTFTLMLRQGLIPEPPEEIEGGNLKIEYISIMAQAQKLVGVGGIERWTGFMGQVAQFDPKVLDKMNTDKLADTYADFTSVPPDLVRSDEEVEQLRAERAQQQAQQQRAEQAQQAASAAKDLGQAEVSEDSALGQLAGV